MIRFLRHIYITQEMEKWDRAFKRYHQIKNGVQRVDSEGIAPDYTGPWDMTLGYLPYYMQGMDMGVLKNEVSDAAAQMGFRCEKRTELLCSGWQDIGILRKIEN